MYQGNSLIIIPSYNEAENIVDIINDILIQNENFHLLIVDDNSPDKTYELVEEEIIKNPKKIFLIKREKKSGLGSAYIEGFKWAIENGYERIFEMDADYSHDPKDLLRMNVFLDNDGYDVVIGSRYVSGLNVINWPIQRVLLSYFASIYARLITGVPVKDLTSGFVGYKVNVLKSILKENIRFKFSRAMVFFLGLIVIIFSELFSSMTSRNFLYFKLSIAVPFLIFLIQYLFLYFKINT